MRKHGPIIAHVNQHVIKHNAKHGTQHPCLTVKHPKLGTVYCHAVSGYATLIDSAYLKRNPLSCGARVWLEYEREGFAFKTYPIDWPTLKTALTADRDANPMRTKEVDLTIEALSPEASA